jgi:hypothetical protein
VKILLSTFLLIFFVVFSARAEDVVLSWEKPADDRVVGYNIYYGVDGTDFKSTPSQTISSADQTSCPILNLEVGQLYGFAATSLDAQANESDFSETIYYIVPGNDLTITGLRVEE